MTPADGAGADHEPVQDDVGIVAVAPPGFWIKTFLWLAVLVAMVAVNELAFRLLLDRSYVSWYLENGVYVGLTFGLVTLAWGDLNKLTGLISAHPLEYLVACLTIVDVSFHGVMAMSTPRAPGVPEGWAEGEGRPFGLSWVDTLLALLFAVVLWLFGFAWLLVAAPLQYVVTLVAGAPARRALASPERSWFQVSAHTVTSLVPDGETAPDKAIESGFTARPVSVTTLLATGLLLVAALLIR